MLKKKLKMINLKALSRECGVSYDVLRHYKAGRIKELKEEYKVKIEEALTKIGE